ncbi:MULTISPECIES: hypothetical protein [Shewanella]|uniref:Secreted protein n=1 Tax=Shewanella marisflavi TaxID=260364 RepID=A0ABX5WIX9_9GAMM|nr:MULTISPECIES: hypothetical protein [Shewanella]QDF74385.1 hypothetical protein FGA12_03935 [Shewanella marisflavi]
MLLICLLLVIFCQSLATGAALSVRYANERHAFGATISHSHSFANRHHQAHHQAHHLSHDHTDHPGDDLRDVEQLSPFNAVESIASLAEQTAAHINSSDIEKPATKYEEHQHDHHSYMASHPPTEYRVVSVQRQAQTLTPLIQVCLTRCDAPPIRPPLLAG